MFLLIFRNDHRPFAESQALESLGLIGVSDLRRSVTPGTAFEGDFRWADDEVLVTVAADFGTFHISDPGPAGLELAVRLQSRFNEPLRIIDEGYSFDLELKNFSTAVQLEETIRSIV